MKFTINGFNQEKLIEYGLDAIDSLILRYFIDFKDTGDMAMEVIEGKPYYWVKYKSLMENIPIIKIKSKDALRRRLKKLEDCKVLEHYHKKQGGNYSFYGVGENYKYLVKKYKGTTQKSEGCDSKVGRVTTQKSEQNISLLKDKSIKDKSIYTTQFLEWFDIYPNPFNKQRSFKNFNKLLKTESFKNIMKATKNYIEYIKQNKVDKQYVVRSTNFVGQKQEYLGYLDMEFSPEAKSKVKTSIDVLKNLDLEEE